MKDITGLAVIAVTVWALFLGGCDAIQRATTNYATHGQPLLPALQTGVERLHATIQPDQDNERIVIGVQATRVAPSRPPNAPVAQPAPVVAVPSTDAPEPTPAPTEALPTPAPTEALPTPAPTEAPPMMPLHPTTALLPTAYVAPQPTEPAIVHADTSQPLRIGPAYGNALSQPQLTAQVQQLQHATPSPDRLRITTVPPGVDDNASGEWQVCASKHGRTLCEQGTRVTQDTAERLGAALDRGEGS